VVAQAALFAIPEDREGVTVTLLATRFSKPQANRGALLEAIIGVAA